MKINKFDQKSLRNDAHFWFHSEFVKLAGETGVETLKIAALWPAHTTLFGNLDTALKKILMSANTPKIHEADKERDIVYSGFKKTLAGLCEHYDTATRDAALKVQVVVHTYGNVAYKPIDEETSAIYNLVQELKSDKYRNIADSLGLTQWVSKLEQRNNVCASLIQERDRENAAKPHTTVKEERRAVDESYRHIVDVINAHLLLGQLTGVETFVDTLNEIIHRYSMKHHHRNHHGGNGTESDETDGEGGAQGE